MSFSALRHKRKSNSRKRARTFGICLGLLVLAACAAPISSGGIPGIAPASAGLGSVPKPAGTPYPYNYVTIDDPNNPDYTLITGINELGKVVGCFKSGSNYRGFSSEPPYASFHGLNYAGGESTCPTSLTSNYIVGGWTVTKLFGGTQTWMFVDDHSIWTIYKDHNGPQGNGMVDELLGINDSNIGVGFYQNTTGTDQPFQVTILTKTFVALHPPNAVSAQATAINGKGDIAGWETLSSGENVGWILLNGKYYNFSAPNSTGTQALSLNWQDQVAGTFTDSKGTHGFVLTNPQKPQGSQIWQTVDEPNAAGTTIVNCVNNHHALSGWYLDSNGNTDGFVATVSGN